jgi:hypothetical protein
MEENTETPQAIPYFDHDVSPLQLLGWLRSVLDDGRTIDVAEWNKAVTTLAGTK